MLTTMSQLLYIFRCKNPPSQTWWQKSSFYQIYVRSFYDSNNDGDGDIPGKKNTIKIIYLKPILPNM